MKVLERLALAVSLGGMANTLQGQAARDGHIIAPDGVAIHYRVVGAGADTVLVLHGGPGLTMDYLIPDLSPLAKHHTLVFYDQRGSGRSTAPLDTSHISARKHITDLDALRAHFGIAQVVILGHSWGAKLAVLYAIAHPDRVARMILEGPGSPKPDARFGRNLIAWADSSALARITQLREAALAPANDRVETCRAFWKEFMRGYWSDPNDTLSMRRMRGDLCSYAGAMSDMTRVSNLTIASVGTRDYALDVRSLRFPVLVLTGRKDPMPLDDSEAWAAAFPDARLVIVERAGHFPHVEQPQLVFATIDSFLRGNWPASAKRVERQPNER